MKYKGICAFLYLFVEYLGGSLWHRIEGNVAICLDWGGVECLNMERVLPFCYSSEMQLF